MDQIGPGISWNNFLDWWGAQSHFDNSVAHFFNLVVVCKYLTTCPQDAFSPLNYMPYPRALEQWMLGSNILGFLKLD